MKAFIRGLSPTTIYAVFGSVYAATLLMALFPPLYLAASGVPTLVLGLPFSIMYWLINALVLGLALWGLFVVEGIRGELDEDHPIASASAGA